MAFLEPRKWNWGVRCNKREREWKWVQAQAQVLEELVILKQNNLKTH
jgi:hypothetical protein